MERLPPSPAISRYERIKLLKQGHGVSTWLARDRASGTEVTLKVAETSALSPERLGQLEREAIILRDLPDPSLARVVEFRSEPQWTWLALRYVPGVTLESRLAGARLGFAETLALARGALGILAAVHERGILHRDIKPSNLIVNEEGVVDRITLIDFGFARFELLDGGKSSLPAGTARYMAPEQSGVLDREPGPFSDLYSLGAVLHECLSGRPLFVGAEVSSVLRAQLNERPPLLRELGVEVPRVFDQWLQHLLQREPSRRYPTAEQAREDLELIIRAQERGEADGGAIRGPETRFALADPAFVGRAEELARLRAAWNATRQGLGELILLEGESGGGKSRLIREFAQSLPRVFRGQAVDQAAQGPFRVFAGVVARALSLARAQPEFGARLREELAAKADAICEAFPECVELFGERTHHGLGPETLGEARLVPAVAAFLESLGTAELPALVVLDDCQWADDLSLRLIAFFQRPPEELAQARRHVLLLAAFRTEEVPSSHRLRQVVHANSVRLERLSDLECQRLVESMAGRVPPEATRTICALSQGNPFMASAILHGLVEEDTLSRVGADWVVDAQSLAHAQASRQAGIYLARRLQGFPQDTLQVLTVGAVIGKEFTLELVAALTEQPESRALAALGEAVSRKVVWHPGDGSVYAFAHDKIRETLLGLLSSQERRQLHLAAARRIERLDPAANFDIAYHYGEAECFREALPYALRSAEQARSRYALQVAERYYQIAESGATGGEGPERLQIAEGLGDVRMLLGKYDEADRTFSTASALAYDPIERARVQGKAGELAFKRGDINRAARILETALESLHVRVPRGNLVGTIYLLREVFVQALHSLWPRRFLAKRPASEGAVDFLRARLLSRLAYVNWFGRGKIACAWAHFKEMNLAERYPPSPELAQAYSEHAPVMTMVPWFSRGVAYAEKSLAIRRELDDLWGQGQSLHFYGIVLYGASRYQESIERCQAAARLLERTGDRWEVNTAQWHTAFALYRLGRMTEALEFARDTYRAGVEIGDQQAAGVSLAAWSKITGGQVPPELLTPERQRVTGDLHTRIELLQADGIRLLRLGDPRAAAVVLDEACNIIRRSGFRQEYVAPALPWLATALRTWLESLPPHAARERAQVTRRWRRALWRARSWAWFYRNNLPHTLRERAYYAAFRGYPRRAIALFAASQAEAQRQSARYEEALTLKARGEIGLLWGWEGAEAWLAQGQAMIESLRARSGVEGEGGRSAPSLSLADRFASVISSGREIVLALSEDEVFASVRRAAQALLRVEDCLVVPLAETRGGTRDRLPSGVSQELVAEMLRTRRPVVFAEGKSLSASESLILSGIRSAICAPILAGGQVVACFYVTHEQIGGLFGEDERRIADYIGTLAGASIEIAQGFSRVAAVSEERSAAVRARDEFLSIASHELRTPLTSLKLQLQHLGRNGLAQSFVALGEERLAKFFDMAERQVDRINRLIEDLLDVSRLSVGQFPLQLDAVPLHAVVTDTLERFMAEIRGADCQVRWSGGPELHVKADRFRIEQVVTNLITNAIKYAKGTSIELDLERIDGMARLRVRDHGPGIRPEDQARIFRRFERATSPSEASGLGLGLFIASEIIKAHHGSIRVESAPGEGSAFILELPLASTASVAALKTARAASVTERQAEL